MRLKEYLRLNNLFSQQDVQTYDFLADYYSDYDKKVIALFGELECLGNDTMEVRALIIAALVSNEYYFRTMYRTLSFQYNPIENYSMTEHTTTVNGERVSTTVYGDTSVTTATGDRSTTMATGELNSSTTNGATTVTNSTGEVVTHGDSEDLVSAFNTNVYSEQNMNNVTSTVDAHTDTSSFEQTTPTTNKVDAHTDTVTSAAATDITTEAEHTDRSTQAQSTDTIDHNRSGNIGTVTAQDMIKQEREIAALNFIDLVVSTVIREITIGVWY